MRMCSVCNENPAVVFISKYEAGKMVSKGYCLSCAIQTGVTPVEQLASQLGVEPDELKNMVDEMQDMMSNGNFEEALSGLMGGNLMNMASDGADEEFDDEEDAPSNVNEKSPKKEKGFKKREKKKCLPTFGINLTEKAKAGELDRVVGREKETDRIIQILNRRTKNNPVLLGVPGVGKTAIAEGVAQKIAKGEVPEKLLDKQVYLLDLASVVAGTQYRGQFESRLKAIVDEAKRDNVVLVIDEVHSIVSAGDADGAMNAANILKPALARGDIQVIGATTLDEYRKHIEKDAALERRFQTVIIEEPTEDEAFEILVGTKGYYEDFHNVTIDNYVIKEIISLSNRYINDRFLPDKAIDVIDEAASKLNIDSPYTDNIIGIKGKIAEIDKKIEELEADTENVQYEELATLKSDKCRLDGELSGLRALQKQTKLTLEDVAQVIELWTGIPVKNITETDKDKLINLEDRLHKRIIGQHDAVVSVAKAVRRNRALMISKKRPVSFIFVGPTGVGKTELVKALAECLFDDEGALVRMDMSEYMEKHAVSKIIGAPPGYVGYDEAGQLTEKVRRRPYSIILLDEIEKAHADVFNILLQILDDGRITDSQGRMVNFKNTIIIMTSNAGTSTSSNNVGFGSENAKVDSKVQAALKEIFRPEFLNRVDEVIQFKELTKDELSKIIELMLSDLRKELKHIGLELTVSEKAKEIMIKNGYNPKYGARPLRREIQTNIEDEVASILLSGEHEGKTKINVTAPNGKIKVVAE